MNRRRALVVGGIVAAALGVVLIFLVPRWYRAASTKASAAAPVAAPATPGRKIKARLFYLSEDGTSLTAVERDVPFADGTVEQAREIVAAQIAPAAEPLVSAVPPGTTLRSVFLTSKGEAYVDLSPEISTAHTGGSLAELLTVYTIVNALTTNLPAVTTVELLVDGKEVPTLSGHVDLRRPLAKNLTWVQ